MKYKRVARWLPVEQALAGMPSFDSCLCRYLSAVQRIANREERSPEKDESFKEVILATWPGIVMEPEHKHMLRVEALTETPERPAQESMALELLQ